MDPFQLEDISPLFKLEVINLYYMDLSICDIFTLTQEPKEVIDESENVDDEDEEDDDDE